MITSPQYRAALVQVHELLNHPLGHPLCPIFVACSSVSGLGVFAKEALVSGRLIMEHGGDLKHEHDARNQDDPITHVRYVGDGSGLVRDAFRWLLFLSPTFTPEQRAAELLLPALERTRVTMATTLINVPGLSAEQGN